MKKPTSMQRAGIRIAALAGILILICAVCRISMRNGYTAYLPTPGDLQPEQLRFQAETPGVVTQGTPCRVGDRMRVPVRPQGPGRTFVTVTGPEGETLGYLYLSVGRFGTVYDHVTGGFTGDSVVLIAVTVFWLAVAAILFDVYRRAKGPSFYAYSTLFAAGFSVFSLVTGTMMLLVTVRHLLHPETFAMLSAYSAICSAGLQFMLLTAPLMLAFALALMISNGALLRHERFRPQNVLGIAVGLLVMAGWALGVFLHGRDFMGSEWEGRLRSTLENVYATAYAYFECMLLGAVVCGRKAARHVPAPEADYILILGCRFRRDGTLTPLLRGRVDRAIEFWREQRRQTGRTAVLVPSGGQGADEVMPEAEAMRRYLLAQGIPMECILPETRSRNTYQNMEYSRALIEDRTAEARVVYVTTNYHVFRSGVWASLAGLPAEGLGSRTRWWYWPNAFMRECAGLLRNRIWQEIALLLAALAFFGALSMALH